MSGTRGLRHGAALATAALGFALGALSLTWRLDQSLYDGTLSLWQRPVADDIVIVAIDDASLAAIGRWPWPRAVHATLLDTLAAGRPRAIALDLLLSEPDADPRADAVLAQAMQRAAPVVLPSYFYAAPMRGVQLLTPPAPLAAAAAAIAHMDTDTDADGVLRHAWLRAGIDEPLRPHLALALLLAAGERVHPSIVPLRAPAGAARAGRWQRDERVAIRYAGPPGTVRAIPYVALLRGDVPAAALAGKLVLIGATAPGLGDAFPTPVSGSAGSMSGVEINAQLAAALRAGDAVRLLPPWLVGALAALLALLLFAAYARLRAGRALQLTLVAVLLAPVASTLLLGAGLWLPPTALALTALIAYPLWSWRRLEAAQRFVDAELARWAGDGAAAGDERGDALDRRLEAVRRAGEQVRQARRFVADSLAALPEAVLVSDADGRVLIANQRAAALLGAADAAALAGQPLADALAPVTPLEAAHWQALVDAAQASGEPRVCRARLGEQVDLLVRLAPFGSAGAPSPALVLSLADVTRLTAAERSRDEMLAFVTHDLRSPQASMVSMAELARFGKLPYTPEQVLEQMELLARRTLQLADSFLQLAAAETRALQPLRFDAAEALREAVDEVRLQAQAGGVQIALELADGPLPLHGELPLLRRACVNLLTNALKASSAGGTVEASARRDEVSGAAVIRVRDHGPGIAPEVRARLFRKYERSADTVRQPGAWQGIGLGLAFVDTVVRRHGGRVSVESTPGAGALFELRLPLAADAGGTAAPAATAAP